MKSSFFIVPSVIPLHINNQVELARKLLSKKKNC